jgi:hypothetical protein
MGELNLTCILIFSKLPWTVLSRFSSDSAISKLTNTYRSFKIEKVQDIRVSEFSFTLPHSPASFQTISFPELRGSEGGGQAILET